MKLEKFVCNFCLQMIGSNSFIQVTHSYMFGLSEQARAHNANLGPFHYCSARCLIGHAQHEFKTVTSPRRVREVVY